MPTKRTKTLDEQILERLAEGELVTKMCRDDAMPSIRQLQRWRRADVEFDSSCWSSEAQGLMVQRSELIVSMHETIKEGGPGSSTQIQGLRELLHKNGRTAGRLVARMSDRVNVNGQVEHQHIIIGWQETDSDIIHVPSDEQKYVDHLKRPVKKAKTFDEKNKVNV